jgi:AbrB family looped-hinge helix DNA binding protein
MQDKMKISKITSNGRITIPAELRKKYRLKGGTRVNFFEEGNGIKIIPITVETIKAKAGFLGMRGKHLKALMEGKKGEREL